VCNGDDLMWCDASIRFAGFEMAEKGVRRMSKVCENEDSRARWQLQYCGRQMMSTTRTSLGLERLLKASTRSKNAERGGKIRNVGDGAKSQYAVGVSYPMKMN